jgi:EKC/KEOPS complex subunit PCC1/LAGE3
VDAEPKRGGTKKELSVSGTSLSVRISCVEAKKLRVSVNSFFDLLYLVNETIERFDDYDQARI